MKGMVSHVNVSRNKKYYSCFQIFVPSYLYVHLCYMRGSMTSGWLELILLWPKQRISHETAKNTKQCTQLWLIVLCRYIDNDSTAFTFDNGKIYF